MVTEHFNKLSINSVEVLTEVIAVNKYPFYPWNPRTDFSFFGCFVWDNNFAGNNKAPFPGLYVCISFIELFECFRENVVHAADELIVVHAESGGNEGIVDDLQTDLF